MPLPLCNQFKYNFMFNNITIHKLQKTGIFLLLVFLFPFFKLSALRLLFNDVLTITIFVFKNQF